MFRERPNVTEAEIRDAVWQCEGSKSLRPNGFDFNFIKNSWETIKHDIFQAVQNFKSFGKIPRGCNASFIS